MNIWRQESQVFREVGWRASPYTQRLNHAFSLRAIINDSSMRSLLDN